MSHIRSKVAVRNNWTTSNSGRQVSFYLASFATCGTLLGNVLPHIGGVPYYVDFVRLYNKGFAVPVPDKLNQRFQRVLDLLKIDKDNKMRFIPFMACGFDMFSAGTLGRFGIHIGLPVNFTYDNVENIDKSKIKLNEQSVIWESDAGKRLLNALIVPENGQLYAIAKEIKMRDSYKLFFDTFYATASVFLTYAGSVTLNQRLNLYSKPRSLRILGYCLIAFVNTANYVMLKDLTQHIYEEKIDKELKELSPIFAEGGKQFYTQILERNKALRVLMGKEGEAKYTVLGNENFLIRTKHLPLVQRKAYFEEQESSSETSLLS
ncbi:transmembrane protein 177 [Anthonomus grandis grandis]|uniref:transmembrane protein 177 n=1 Tax=Anthonomus grandis grandis TaxID=2921223 RepID=UPI00216631FB|nr:transmembrane protein 177 [Anthonomus grandis grandis]